MGRKKEFDDSRILEVATNLFLRKGFGGTSYEDLTYSTGLVRPSLYNAYGDKTSLFCHCLKYFAARDLEASIKILNDSNGEPQNAIKNALLVLVGAPDSEKRKNGCLFVNTLFDPVALSYANISETISTMLRPFKVAFSHCLSQGIKSTAVQKQQIDDATEFLFLNLGGLRWYAKTEEDLGKVIKNVEYIAIATTKIANGQLRS
jgi:TetR/AcrR family transcriptional repressor of nem operon